MNLAHYHYLKLTKIYIFRPFSNDKFMAKRQKKVHKNHFFGQNAGMFELMVVLTKCYKSQENN